MVVTGNRFGVTVIARSRKSGYDTPLLSKRIVTMSLVPVGFYEKIVEIHYTVVPF
jgi:hypothetical protein